MKNVLLLLVAAIAFVAWIASLFWDDEAVASSAAQPWPGAMGTLDSVVDRFPPLQANEASRKLTALAEALPRNEAADAYVRREMARGELAIGEPPALADVSLLRELLLQEPIVWERRESFDDTGVGARRGLVMTAARALIATALARGRAAEPAAWDDLRAAWNLARTQDGHPQMMAQTAALTISRMTNAIAWKLPLPAPDWLGDLAERDAVRPLLDAFQYQTASYWKDGAKLFPSSMLATSVDHDRSIAEQLFGAAACEPEVAMNDLGPDLRSVWRRAFRYRVEREATANALRARAGRPIEPKSACSAGTWSFDGTTLRYSREIPLAEDELPMPLVLRIL